MNLFWFFSDYILIFYSVFPTLPAVRCRRADVPSSGADEDMMFLLLFRNRRRCNPFVKKIIQFTRIGAVQTERRADVRWTITSINRIKIKLDVIVRYRVYIIIKKHAAAGARKLYSDGGEDATLRNTCEANAYV